jgi:hypothetical protein
MRFSFLALVAALPFSLATADSVVEEAADFHDAANCAMAHTDTMCMVKAVAAVDDKEPVPVRQAIYGQSETFYVVTGTSNWLRHTREGKADLVFVDDSASAFIEFTWQLGDQEDFDALAREGLGWLTDTVGGEPNKYEISWEPYQSHGSIYEACYSTRKNTTECAYSAAVELRGGTARAFSITAADPDLTQQVLTIIASLSAPRRVDRETRGDVLTMPSATE